MHEQTLPERDEVVNGDAPPSPRTPTPTPPLPGGKLLRTMRPAVGIVLLLALVVFFLGFVGVLPVPGLAATPKEEQTVPPVPPLGVDLVRGRPHTLRVPADVRIALGVRKGNEDRVAVAVPPREMRPLVLSGSTALDPTRLFRIRARFAPAEVVEIGKVPETSEKTGRTEFRELRPGDVVRKGDLLGVFYSVDVGSKKNDLIDALVQLKLDQLVLDRALEKRESVPEVFLLNQRRAVEGDHNAIARALNTLKTWNIPEADIQAVRDEAEQISKRGGRRDKTKEDQWARVELRAPDDGTIVERNVALHEMVVDNTVNLFQVARVDRLVVVANAAEDDLPTFERLPHHLRRWTVRAAGAPEEGIPGRIDEISYLIDVNQHSAVLKGHIDNPDSRLRAGQFVSAAVNLPPPRDVVEVPAGAVVDDGRQCVVFVREDPASPEQYTMRRVEVTHRFEKTVYVRSRWPDDRGPGPTPDEKELGLLPRQALRKGEQVLTAGVLELKKELEDRELDAAAGP